MILVTCRTRQERIVATFVGKLWIAMGSLYHEPYPMPVARYDPDSNRWYLTKDNTPFATMHFEVFEP